MAAEPTSHDDLPRGVGYEPMVVAGGIWLVAKLLRYAFPALFPTVRGELGVPNAWLGGAFTAMMLAYSLMQFPSGVLADRLNDVRVIAAGALIAAVGATVFVLPVSFPLFVLAMLLVGLGTGVHKTVSVGLLSRLYPERTGRALGLFDTFGTLGGVLAPAAVVLAVAVADWRALFVVTGLVGAALTLALVVRVPPKPTSGSTVRGVVDDLTMRAYLEPFRERRFLLFVGITLCFSFAYNGATAFLPLFLVEAGLSEATASGLYSLLFIASLGQIVTGDLSDRFGRLPLVVVVLTLAAVALGSLVALGASGPLALGVAVVAFGIGSHGFRPLRGAYLSTAFPAEVAGGGLGFVRTLLMASGAISPVVVGVVADTAGFRLGFSLLAAVMALAALFAVATVVSERGGADETPG